VSRQQRRQAERNEAKARKRLFTYDECRRIALKMLDEQKAKYDTLYLLASISALHAEPFRFGRKRIAEFTNLFFGQVDGINAGTIDAELLLETAESLGFTFDK
jgi:hypothetical protein